MPARNTMLEAAARRGSYVKSADTQLSIYTSRSGANAWSPSNPAAAFNGKSMPSPGLCARAKKRVSRGKSKRCVRGAYGGFLLGSSQLATLRVAPKTCSMPRIPIEYGLTHRSPRFRASDASIRFE